MCQEKCFMLVIKIFGLKDLTLHENKNEQPCDFEE